MVSFNLKRRHLDEAQRAMVAARIANMRQGERTDLEPSANLPKVDQPTAASMLNVGERSVRSAREVLDHGAPELVNAVDQGRVAVSTAADVASRTSGVSLGAASWKRAERERQANWFAFPPKSSWMAISR